MMESSGGVKDLNKIFSDFAYTGAPDDKRLESIISAVDVKSSLLEKRVFFESDNYATAIASPDEATKARLRYNVASTSANNELLYNSLIGAGFGLGSKEQEKLLANLKTSIAKSDALLTSISPESLKPKVVDKSFEKALLAIVEQWHTLFGDELKAQLSVKIDPKRAVKIEERAKNASKKAEILSSALEEIKGGASDTGTVEKEKLENAAKLARDVEGATDEVERDVKTKPITAYITNGRFYGTSKEVEIVGDYTNLRDLTEENQNVLSHIGLNQTGGGNKSYMQSIVVIFDLSKMTAIDSNDLDYIRQVTMNMMIKAGSGFAMFDCIISALENRITAKHPHIVVRFTSPTNRIDGRIAAFDSLIEQAVRKKEKEKEKEKGEDGPTIVDIPLGQDVLSGAYKKDSDVVKANSLLGTNIIGKSFEIWVDAKFVLEKEKTTKTYEVVKRSVLPVTVRNEAKSKKTGRVIYYLNTEEYIATKLHSDDEKETIATIIDDCYKYTPFIKRKTIESAKKVWTGPASISVNRSTDVSLSVDDLFS